MHHSSSDHLFLSSYEDTRHFGLGATLLWCVLIFNNSSAEWSSLQIRSHSELLGIRTSTCLSSGHISTHHLGWSCYNLRIPINVVAFFPLFCSSRVFRWLCVWLSHAVLIDFPWNVYPSINAVNSKELGTSLVVQWPRLCVPNAGSPGLIPGQETRSYMPQLRCSTAK